MGISTRLLLSFLRRNTKSTTNANEMSEKLKDNAGNADTIRTYIARMNEIITSGRRIADMAQLMEKIAFQTNTLALNAAIEAVRAGEKGRGFAVVASELRILAQNTASTVKEINHVVSDTVDKIAKQTEEFNQSGNTLEEIEAKIIDLADIISDISTAFTDQQNSAGKVKDLASLTSYFKDKKPTLH